MEDHVGSYIAEFCLIVSITSYTHVSSVLLSTFMPHLFRLMILFFSFTRFYLLLAHLQAANYSFKFLYWKYFVISIIMVEISYDGEEGEGAVFINLLVLLGLTIILLHVMIVYRHGWNLEERRAGVIMQPLMRVAWDIVIMFFHDGIGFVVTAFVHRNFSWKMVVLLLLYFCVLGGFLFQIFADFIALFCFFCVVSYASFLWFRIGIGFKGGEEQLDFCIRTIPIPFDIICFFLCHYIVILTGGETYVVGGKVLELLFWGFSMVCITIVFFMYYYYYYYQNS